MAKAGSFRVKSFDGNAKGGVIMDVTTPEQAKIAESAGAVAVMALERVPADIPLKAVWPVWPTQRLFLLL